MSVIYRLVIALAAVVVAVGGGLIVRQQASARSNVGAGLRQGTTNHTVSVGGHGEVNVPPDMAVLTLGVESRASDAKQAQANSSAKMSTVIAAVKALGVPDNKIATNNVSLYYAQDQGVYVANQSIQVTLDDISKVGPAIDAGVNAGADSSWGVSFGLQDPGAARAQALQAAVADARKRANAIASALGVSITGVGSATEASYQQVARYAASTQSSAATPVEPGQLTVSADVNVVYTFG